jgi:hypothetical protein
MRSRKGPHARALHLADNKGVTGGITFLGHSAGTLASPVLYQRPKSSKLLKGIPVTWQAN